MRACVCVYIYIYIIYYEYIYIYIYIYRAGKAHTNINSLKTSCLDKSDFLLAFNGSSCLTNKLAFNLFTFMWTSPVLGGADEGEHSPYLP